MTHAAARRPPAAAALAPGARRLVLPADLSLRDALAAAFRDVLRHAAAVRGPRALHEQRRSVRRARALLRLCRPLLDDRVHAALRRTLRDCHAETSPLRDAEALASALRAVRGVPAVRAEAAVVRLALLARQRSATPPARVHEVLARQADVLAALPDFFARALAPGIAGPDLLASLRGSFRRARRAAARAAKTRRGADLHAWRKRVKELRYQLELVGAGKARRRAARLADALGEVAAALRLRDHLAAAGPRAARLRRLLDQRIARDGRRLLAAGVADRPPRKAARALAARA
jgi:CHAD domain-containing protein